MRSTPDWATAWMVASEIPPEASNSTVGRRSSRRRTASAIISGMLSSKMMSTTPASKDNTVSSWSKVSTSTSTNRIGPMARAALQAASRSVPNERMVAKWLSLKSAASKSPNRCKRPPPQCTAYFCSPRKPGKVCGSRRWRPESRRPSQPAAGWRSQCQKGAQQIQHGAFHREQVRVTPRQGGLPPRLPRRPGLRRQQPIARRPPCQNRPKPPPGGSNRRSPRTPGLRFGCRRVGLKARRLQTSHRSRHPDPRHERLGSNSTEPCVEQVRRGFFDLKSTVIRSHLHAPEPSIGNHGQICTLHPIEASALRARRERVFLVLAGLFWVHSPC